jgi:hypothetical protein
MPIIAPVLALVHSPSTPNGAAQGTEQAGMLVTGFEHCDLIPRTHTIAHEDAIATHGGHHAEDIFGPGSYVSYSYVVPVRA